jgi:hypothetical protein
MSWDGTERREDGSERQAIFCSQHIPLITDITTIKSSVMNIEKELTQGMSFKQGMISSFIGVAAVLLIQIATFAFLYGQLVNQVKVNTSRLSILEEKAHGKVNMSEVFKE